MAETKEETVNLQDYLVVMDWNQMGQPLDSPEDIAIAEAINREMEIVSRKASSMFARSAELARHQYLTRSR